MFGRNQRRTERFLRGGSLGRSLTRSLGIGLYDNNEKSSMKEVHEADGKPLSTEDTSRISLRLHSLNYLKKFSSWKIPQGSLTRVLSLRQSRQFSFPNYKSFIRPVQSPTSSEHGSVVSAFSYRASSPPELGRPISPSVNLESEESNRNSFLKRRQRHRRVKSIGDITVTPV